MDASDWAAGVFDGVADLNPPLYVNAMWQPIETAPKDGTKVDLWVVDYDGFAHRIPNALWGTPPGATDEFWFYFRSPSWASLFGKPTHWMPLPEPPRG